MDFPPNRTAALERLQAFLPHAGRDYAAQRNHDLPDQGHPHVSRLSPYLRHRLILEAEVLQAVLDRFSSLSAAKFVQEVFWRSYWKGWLELRPGVWKDYRRGVAAARNRLACEAGLRREWNAACNGRTGIDAFDHWARELVATGYLHNHARMWFASIWIFTLRLPWELGADLFLRHLLDGDPASNTLSWRWVGGLQTRGKIYLARPDNIAAFTGGRFRPQGLARDAAPLDGPPPPPPMAPPTGGHWRDDLRSGLILCEDDLSPGWLWQAGLRPRATALLDATAGRSPLAVADPVRGFAAGAMADTRARHAERLGPVLAVTADTDPVPALLGWARAADLQQVVAPHAQVGPAAEALARLHTALQAHDIALVQPVRDFDAMTWPHATNGFFRFRDHIPQVLDGLRHAA